MPKTTMVEENEWKLPKDTPLPARLNAVNERQINFTNRDGNPDSFTKWEWEFLITDGDYAGLKAWGDTNAKMTSHPEDKVRQWAEALTGETFAIGDGIDTDALLGIDCTIVVDNTTYQKKGTKETKYLCPVVDVFPAGEDFSEPPF